MNFIYFVLISRQYTLRCVTSNIEVKEKLNREGHNQKYFFQWIDEIEQLQYNVGERRRIKASY